MNKEVLRSMFLEKRLTLTKTELAKRNERLLRNCKTFIEQHQEIQHTHIFLSMSEKNEPDTPTLIDWLIQERQVKVYSSKTFYKQRRLTHHLVANSSDFNLGNKGIPEPKNSDLIVPTLFDLVFVPLISFDEQGNRIGYGAGLYDRFLNEVRSDCLKVGLAITPPLNNIDYTNEFDVSLDLCINHLGVYQF